MKSFSHFQEYSHINMTMYSNVTIPQSRAPLGCGRVEDSHHRCAADKSATTV